MATPPRKPTFPPLRPADLLLPRQIQVPPLRPAELTLPKQKQVPPFRPPALTLPPANPTNDAKSNPFLPDQRGFRTFREQSQYHNPMDTFERLPVKPLGKDDIIGPVYSEGAQRDYSDFGDKQHMMNKNLRSK